MKKTWVRGFSLLLAAAMLLTVAPLTAAAAGEYVVTVVVEPSLEFDDIYSFSEGLARVRKNDKYGFIDNTGELVA
ncbi:MAG: WG repeat-containing protein, partial [Oscillospiraceae bacterium]|nr:WG repeat-containing protein [Oscillospiraceae bacterium]